MILTRGALGASRHVSCRHWPPRRLIWLQQHCVAEVHARPALVHGVASTSPAAVQVQPADQHPGHHPEEWLGRTSLLVGPDNLARLATLRVLLVGLGGVGSFAAEFLVRAGVGSLTIVDGDCVDVSNKNRQLPALSSTVGRPKAAVMSERLADINPQLALHVRQEFLTPDTAAALATSAPFDYVVDCIDTVAPKCALLVAAHRAGIQVVSSMGAGGRLDPSRVRIADIAATYNDAFAAVVRKRLRKAGVASGVTVVFSDELARPASLALTDQRYKQSYFGTISYLPALFGLHIAAHVVREVADGEQYRGPARGAAAVAEAAAAVRGTHKPKPRKGQRRARGDGCGDGCSDGSLSHSSSSSPAAAEPAAGPAAARNSPANSSSKASGQQGRPKSVEGSKLDAWPNPLGVGAGYDGSGI